MCKILQSQKLFISQTYDEGPFSFWMSYMTKIDKSIPFKLHSIIQKFIENKTNANTRIQNFGNTYFNAQQMVIEFVVYFVLSSPLYYSSQTF
jgi:hypothetical protein